MLINLRNALMSGRRLPYDAEVEYIESTSSRYAYFNTGIDASSDIRAVGRFRWLSGSVGNDRYIIAQTGSTRMYFGTYKSKWMFGFRDFTQPNSPLPQENVDYEFDVRWYSKRPELFINGESIIAYGSETGISDNGKMLIFSRQTNLASYSAHARIYYCKIWQNGTLVRDFIPVRKGTVGYLYDRVSKRLFGNAGTGDFVLGPDVVPVEYIESHGMEYIDTKVIATNSHGFRVDVATAQKIGGLNTRIFGVHEGNVRCGFALYGTIESSGNDFFWGWNAATGFMADIPQRFVVSLNYKNDRAAIFNGTTNLSSLGTLGNTTKSIYLLNANYNGAPFASQYVIGRLYKAEISIGSNISNNFLPVRVGTEGAMMDVLTRRIYRNAGTGAFGYGNDLKYPIPAAS